MVEWLRQFTDKGQRQSFVLNLSALLSVVLLITLIAILLLIGVRGMSYFWPQTIVKVSFYEQGQRTVFAHVNRYRNDKEEHMTLRFSDEASPFGVSKQIATTDIVSVTPADSAALIVLRDGREILAEPSQLSSPDADALPLSELDTLFVEVNQLSDNIEQIKATELSRVHEKLAEYDSMDVKSDAPARTRWYQAFRQWQGEIASLEARRSQYRLQVSFADGGNYTLAMSDIDKIVPATNASLWRALVVLFENVLTFLTDSPKQANTTGGVFPALFGTVLMVFVMTIIVTPFGVLAAIYLSEYAPDNGLTAAIRISVSNMAGVPSIVYGVFGLGFFVYGIGGSIDELLFSDKLPSPTMGSPGLFWASLTMALLTLPVVIVATEEGLRRVPDGLKAGSYALGATKAETVIKTVLPIASPGIMTGVILAIARAAGEVAPLMLVGAVKFAPNLPIDSEFPYLHLDRQFMHLGVLIYDGAFHSQTDAKGAPIMFASCLLLLCVVFVLNMLAAILRTKLRKRYLIG